MEIRLREFRTGILGRLQSRSRIKTVFALYVTVSFKQSDKLADLPPVFHDQQYLKEMIFHTFSPNLKVKWFRINGLHVERDSSIYPMFVI